MVELFQNPNVATALVERLPCAFAPSVDGKMGTHYAMVLLDKKGNVIYVGSECEHKHGEGVQVLHEMGDQDSTLCYVVTAAFRKALRTLHDHPDAVLNEKDHRPKDANILTGHMWQMFSKVFSDSIEKHNKHVYERTVCDWSRHDFRLAALQRTVNQVTGSLLGLPKTIETGSWPGKGTVLGATVVEQVEYPLVLDVKYSECYTMHFHNWSRSFATREAGSWTVDEDAIKSFAKDNHTTFERAGRFSKLYDERRCLFCAEDFQRMSKHTQGARHIDRVLEIAKLACKATSRMGLQMLNNPRTRSVFIKR